MNVLMVPLVIQMPTAPMSLVVTGARAAVVLQEMEKHAWVSSLKFFCRDVVITCVNRSHGNHDVRIYFGRGPELHELFQCITMSV